MQWGNKMKGSSVLQNILKGMSSLQKGCVSLFYSQVGRDKLNKGTFSLQSSRGAESSRQAIEYNYNNKSKSKKQFSTRSQNWLPSCNNTYYTLFSFVSSALRQKFGIDIQLPVFPISSLPTSQPNLAFLQWCQNNFPFTAMILFLPLLKLLIILCHLQIPKPGLLWWFSDIESSCQCRRHRFNP